MTDSQVESIILELSLEQPTIFKRKKVIRAMKIAILYTLKMSYKYFKHFKHTVKYF